MNMLFRTVILGVLLATSVATSAQESMAETARGPVQETMERLELTEEQIEKVEPVLEQAASKRDQIMKKYGVNPDRRGSGGNLGLRSMRSMKKEMDTLRADTVAELKDILSSEQLSEYQQIQQERQKAMQKRMRG